MFVHACAAKVPFVLGPLLPCLPGKQSWPWWRCDRRGRVAFVSLPQKEKKGKTKKNPKWEWAERCTPELFIVKLFLDVCASRDILDTVSCLLVSFCIAVAHFMPPQQFFEGWQQIFAFRKKSVILLFLDIGNQWSKFKQTEPVCTDLNQPVYNRVCSSTFEVDTSQTDAAQTPWPYILFHLKTLGCIINQPSPGIYGGEPSSAFALSYSSSLSWQCLHSVTQPQFGLQHFFLFPLALLRWSDPGRELGGDKGQWLNFL